MIIIDIDIKLRIFNTIFSYDAIIGQYLDVLSLIGQAYNNREHFNTE